MNLVNLDELMASAPVLLDGALGTELLRRGLEDGACPDSWNLQHPDLVAEVARSYAQAGSQIVLTNTFRANRIALQPYGLADQARAINRAGVGLAREGAGGHARVFASLGPSGKLIAAEEIGEAELRAAFEEQAAVLAEAGADALVLETMSDAEEAAIALAACRRTGLPAVVSFTYDSGRRRDRTLTGLTPEQAAARMTDAGADAIGANCGAGIAEYVEICRRLRAATRLPLWIKPNAGLPEIENGRPVYRCSPEEFAERVPALLEAGAAFVGGCCGTNPEFIRACARRLGPPCA